MQVIFAGGASSIGASCVAIQIANQWIVVDAGVRVDHSADPLPDLALLEDKEVKAIFVTHAHADHIGALPLLHRAFPNAPIFASRATHLLMEIMLADALKIMNKRAAEEMEIPLYPETLVNTMLTRVRPLAIGENCTLPQLPGITVHTSRAGHIAGAMSIGFASEHESVVVSGDISVTSQRTILGATPPNLKHPDLLVLESTYGARLHPNRQAEEQRMAQAVAAGLAQGGHVLLPCFGLGRGQEILLLLQAAQEQGQIPLFPIYVDGLIRRVCTAYQLLPEALTPRLERQIRKGFLPFQGDNVHFVRDARERQTIIDGPPACIIASSGMLTGGPSAWYAARLASNPNASILITGYQDEESPGKRLLDVADHRQEFLEIEQQQIAVHCTVAKYSLSAHADGSELATYAAQLKPRRVALVHGDEEARHALRQLLENSEVLLPTNGDTLNVTARHQKQKLQSQLSAPVVLATPELPYGIGGNTLFNAAHLEILWRALAHIPSFQLVTIRDLVNVWYGDNAIPEHAMWLQDVLEDEQPYDEPYFTPAVEIPEAYYIRRTQQDTRDDLLRSLVGRVVLLRTNPEAAKPVLCRAIDARETLRVLFPIGEPSDRTRYPIRALLDVVGPLTYKEGDSERQTLTTSVRAARSLRRGLSAYELARVCNEEDRYTLTDLCNLAGVAAHVIEERLAIAKLVQRYPRLFERYDDFFEGQGLVHYRLASTWRAALAEPEQRERPDQHAILQSIEAAIGNPPHLYRRSVNPETGDVVLAFHFPEPAQQEFGEALTQLSEEIGVAITIATHTHQGELTRLAKHAVQEAGIEVQDAISLRVEQQCIVMRTKQLVEPAVLTQVQDQVQQETGWHLLIEGATQEKPEPSQEQPESPTVTQQKVPQHEALAFAQQVLQDCPDCYKIGVDPRAGTILVRFYFPDTAFKRYGERMHQIEVQTGWLVIVHPLVHQEALSNLAQDVLPEGLQCVKQPSLRPGLKQVAVSCEGIASGDAIFAAERRFTEESGWSLALTVRARP